MAVILIIEDDAFIRQIAEMALQDWGYQTLAADGVEKALAFLNSDQIIDVLFYRHLPQESGSGRLRSCHNRRLPAQALCRRSAAPIASSTRCSAPAAARPKAAMSSNRETGNGIFPRSIPCCKTSSSTAPRSRNSRSRMIFPPSGSAPCWSMPARLAAPASMTAPSCWRNSWRAPWISCPSSSAICRPRRTRYYANVSSRAPMPGPA